MPPEAQITSLLDAAVSQAPARPALAHAGGELTFRELTAAVDRLAASLEVRPGERVVVIAPNVPALVVGLFATWRAGAVAVPLSSRLRRFELARVFSDASPAAAISVASHGGFSFSDELTALLASVPTLTHCVLVDELGEISEQTRSSGGERADPLGPEVAAIMYTSGTTGEPKGALMSHALGEAEARALADVLGDHAAAAGAFVVPIPHAFGLGCLLCTVAAAGLAVLVDSSASLDPLLQAIGRHDAQVLHGTPALFARLLRGGAELPVRTGFTAGSAAPPEALEELDRRGTRILNLYGMTEIGAATTCRLDDPAAVRYRTVGRPLPGYEFRVVPGGEEPSGGAAIPAGAEGDVDPAGEIEVRGPYVSAGYHGRAWTAEETAGEGWFRTGDLGSLDPAGHLSVAGRAKEVVHVGGFNVFPAEVENFLLTHPEVDQAAVIGVAHPTMGEALQAFVVPAPRSALEPLDVVRFARGGIAGYKVPYSVRVVGELPLLPSGKPDRRQLAQADERGKVMA